MAIVVLPSQQVVGIQTESQFCLAFLLWIMDTTTFPNPFAVADVKTALDAGQPAAWETANFDQVLSNCLNMNLDTTALTLTERTRLNTIYEYLSPSPQSFCGGIDAPTLLNTSMANYARVGSATFENELQVLLDFDVDSNIHKVICAAVAANGGAPAPTTVTPFDFLFKECDSNISKRVFTKIWIDFASTPIGGGFSYDFDLDFVDINNVSIATLTISGFAFT